MVVRERDAADADLIFQALADSTRRDIVRRVIEREQSVSMLAEGYLLSFAAIQKHVAVLERATLVSKTRRGREQIVQANRDTLRRAGELLGQYEQLWRHREQAISNILSTEEAEE